MAGTIAQTASGCGTPASPYLKTTGMTCLPPDYSIDGFTLVENPIPAPNNLCGRSR